MSWQIQGLSLPINPNFAEFRTVRPSNVAPVILDFPLPISGTVAERHLIIKGLIWPASAGRQLKEIIRNAGEQNVEIVETEGIYSGVYMITRGSVIQTTNEMIGPDSGLVYRYEIDFILGADTGSVQDSSVQSKTTVEEGVGDGGFVDDDWFETWWQEMKDAGVVVKTSAVTTINWNDN